MTVRGDERDRWAPRPPRDPGRAQGRAPGRGPARPSGPPPRPAWWRGPLALGPGLRWPAVVGAATLVTILLGWFGAYRSGLLGLVFPVGYVAACALAVCAARRDETLVPALTPPVVATVAVLAACLLTGRTSSTTTFLLSVLAPLAELFWWMLLATVLAVGVWYLRSSRPDLLARLAARRRR